jgi:DNA-binding CsgD family transcriptional regulator
VRHASAADTLAEGDTTDERVAAHLLLTAPARDDRHARILRSAAQDAARRGAPDAAVVYLRRALDEPPPSDDLAGILLDLGRCELAEMEFSGAEEHLREALATSGDDANRARAASLLGRCAALSGGLSAEAAATTLESMAAELSDADGERSLDLGAVLLILTASIPRLRSDLPRRLARFRRQAAGDPRYEAVAEIHASQEALLHGGPAAASVERTQRAVAAGLPAEAVINTFFVALTTFIYAERYDLASALLDAGLEMTRQQGHAARQGILHGQRAAIALAKGALDDAQVEADTGLALVSERHFVVLQLAAVSMAVQIERGDLEAAAAAAELGSVFGVTEDRMFLDDYLTCRGRLRIAQGDVSAGVADLLLVGERLEALDVRWPSSWRAYAAPALASLGEEERAAELAREQIDLARRVGARCALGRALRTGGLAIAGEAGLELLEEAVGVLEATPARLELAHALADLGTELGRRRRRREGREVLRLAMELAVNCGALALADRARAELASGGGRRPRLELTGVNALTPAERRVCELAADGDLTNRAIAQSLFVTEKTVELHLTSAYRKLGIRSRFQLATALSS